MAETNAEKATIVAMMENIHRRWDTSAADVKIMSLDNKPSVVAGANLQAWGLLLPPCIPKNCKVYDVSSEHPMAVPVTISLASGDDGGVAAQDAGQHAWTHKHAGM